MDFTTMLTGINLERLYAIALRVVSVETVQDVQAFAQKVQEASGIMVQAALRIAGIAELQMRGLDAEHDRQIKDVCTQYQIEQQQELE